MSLDIDPKKSNLSKYERKYLQDRGKLPVDEPEEKSDDYTSGWNQQDRKEELARRGLPTEGSAKELVLRLRESDESEEEEDEESEEEE